MAQIKIYFQPYGYHLLQKNCISHIVKTTSTSPEVNVNKEIADSLIRPKTRKYNIILILCVYVCYIFTYSICLVSKTMHMHFAMLYIIVDVGDTKVYK